MKKMIFSLILFFSIIFLFALLNADDKSEKVIHLIVKNPFNYPIYIQSSLWEVYLLKKDERLFSYPDSSYKLNFIVLSSSDHFHYCTKKFDILSDFTLMNNDVSLIRIKPKEDVILNIILDSNFSNKDIKRVLMLIPYAKKHNFNFDVNKVTQLPFTVSKDTLEVYYEMKYVAQNILECKDDVSNTQRIKFKEVIKYMNNHFIISYTLE